MAKPAGATVRLNVVRADKPPGSVATTVTVKGEPTGVEGTPVMVLGETKLRPAGNPLTASVRLLGVSASVNVVAGMVKL